MSKLIAKIPSLAAKMPTLAQGLVAASRPKLNTFMYYAKVELVPPTPAEVGEAVKGFQQVINSAKTGKWRQLTVKEGWLNTLVTVEILCWFFVGEIIGKGSLVGYKV